MTRWREVYAELSPPLRIETMSGPRADTRTGQSMPHRRSSDVASAVWLIAEEAISRLALSHQSWRGRKGVD